MAEKKASGYFSEICCGFAASGTSSDLYPHDVNVSCNWTLDWSNLDSMILTLDNLVFTSSNLKNNYYDWYFGVVSGSSLMEKNGPRDADMITRMDVNGAICGDGNPASGRSDFVYNAGSVVWNIGSLYRYDSNGEKLKDEDGNYLLRYEFDSNGNLVIWLGGCSTYNVDKPVYPYSKPISFYANPPLRDQILKYFPWERRISNVWYSLNREGSTSTSAGLFRIRNGAWSPVTNIETGNDDHGFRYNNGWQKSPKSGQGA